MPFGDRDDRSILPVPLTSFIGREREIVALGALLRDPGTRLVTLTGVGGVGKTRLAIRTATELSAEDHFTDGVVYVDLAPVREADLVIPAIAQALNVRAVGQDAAISALKAFIRRRRFLLILDNFEQVIDAGPAVSDLVRSCPDLHVLVTSRSLLNLSGEQAMPVPPLSLRPPSSVPRPPSSDAVRLFVERSQALNPGFSLTATNQDAIAEIVQRLDGLPLAIELAAARGTLLSPSALLARIDRPLPHLTGGPRDQPQRHRTMRAAIAWSYELLTPEEQRVFRCLGVFAGGSTLDAAGTVCAPMDPSGEDRGARDVAVESVVESLARQSLVRSVEPPGSASSMSSPRVGMLETIREFAVEQLAAAGEVEAIRDRHAAWFLDVVESLDLHHAMQGDTARMRRLMPEQDNLRQALSWFATRGNDLSFNRLSAALAIFWFDLGQFAEARTWLHRAIAREDGVPVLTRARAWNEAGWLAMCQGELDLAQSFRDQALVLAREAGEPYLLADAIFRNGILAFWQDDLQQAAALIEDARNALLAIGTEVAAAPVKATAAVNLLGGVALISGDVPLAIQRGEEAVAMARALGAGADLSYALCGLGYARLQEGSVPEAAACFLEATALAWTIRDDAFLARLLWAMAAVAITSDHLEVAARLIGAADALDARTGSAMWPNDRALAKWCLARLEGTLDAAAWSDLRRAGASLAVEQAVVISQKVAAMVLGGERAAAIWQATGAPDLGAAQGELEPEGERMALTPRELDVLHQLVEGRTDREIAAHLFITRRTASKHVEAILSKLGVRSRGAAVVEARRMGLAPTSSPNPEA